MDEAWPQKISSHAVADEVTGLFEMSKEAIRSAFVQLRLLGNSAQLQAIVGSVEQIEDGEDLCKNSNRCSVGFADFHREGVSSGAIVSIAYACGNSHCETMLGVR